MCNSRLLRNDNWPTNRLTNGQEESYTCNNFYVPAGLLFFIPSELTCLCVEFLYLLGPVLCQEVLQPAAVQFNVFL